MHMILSDPPACDHFMNLEVVYMVLVVYDVNVCYALCSPLAFKPDCTCSITVAVEVFTVWSQLHTQYCLP